MSQLELFTEAASNPLPKSEDVFEMDAASYEAASETYSADRIMNGKIRSSFEFQQRRWVCTGIMTGRQRSLKAQMLVPLTGWIGGTRPYTGGLPFTYHGIKVARGRESYVLSDPQITITTT